MENREKKINTVKKIAGWASKFCVSAFFSALSASVVGTSNGKGKKIERYAAMAGGYLVGSMVGDKVTEYVCNGIDEIYAEYERIEAESKMETEKIDIQGGAENG